MEEGYFCGAILIFFAIIIDGSLSAGSDQCKLVQSVSSVNFVCRFPPGCCSRLLCPVTAGLGEDLAELDIRINPCSSPTTLDIIVLSRESVLFNMSGISTSQSIPVRYEGFLDTSVDLFFSSSNDSVTIGLSTFGATILPPTTIPVSDIDCSDSMSQPAACFTTHSPPAATEPGPTPVSDETCQALLQVAASANLAGIPSPNQCQVNQQCTAVNCNNYYGQFAFTLTLLTCNNPPAIVFVAYEGSELKFNQTLSDSRRILLDSDMTIIMNINHPCGQDAIIVEALISIPFSDITLIPPTIIPIDRSHCTNVAATITPCVEDTTNFSDVCDAVQSAIQSTASTCTTNHPECTLTICDLNNFNIPATFGYTILPCTAVPSVRFTVANSGTLIVDETLSKTQMQTISVGPTNVSMRFIVEEDPPLYHNVGVGVNLVSTDPEVDVPVFPLTQIPLDRCSCSNITCPTVPGILDPAVQGVIDQANTTLSEGRNAEKSGHNASGIIIPAAIAAVLFAVLIVIIAVSVTLFVLLRRSHQKFLQLSSISYQNVRAQEVARREID